jgi:hypothetical protein
MDVESAMPPPGESTARQTLSEIFILKLIVF